MITDCFKSTKLDSEETMMSYMSCVMLEIGLMLNREMLPNHFSLSD